jgi:hypothetical protein
LEDIDVAQEAGDETPSGQTSEALDRIRQRLDNLIIGLDEALEEFLLEMRKSRSRPKLNDSPTNDVPNPEGPAPASPESQGDNTSNPVIEALKPAIEPNDAQNTDTQDDDAEVPEENQNSAIERQQKDLVMRNGGWKEPKSPLQDVQSLGVAHFACCSQLDMARATCGGNGRQHSRKGRRHGWV